MILNVWRGARVPKDRQTALTKPERSSTNSCRVATRKGGMGVDEARRHDHSRGIMHSVKVALEVLAGIDDLVSLPHDNTAA